MCETGIHYCSHAGCNCVHDINGLTFSCNSGYELSGTYDCEDIDECQTGDHDCGNDPGMTCYNNVGSFDCMCDGGYDYTANPTPTCTDQNECTLGTHQCCEIGCDCNNISGGYTCSCQAGFETDNTLYGCKDVDECATGVHDCGTDPGMNCVNNVGSFDCICDEEYSNAYSFQTGKTCVNVDECTLNTHNCCTHAGCSGCTDTDPGFTCACDAGYQGDGTSCAEIDECATGAHNCGTDPGMNCVNNDGSFDCICDEEYSNAYSFVTGKTCVNVDECTLNTHNCCTHAGCSGCTDTDPGFTCACDVGYQGDGTSCAEIDECATGAHNCGTDPGMNCVNNDGSFDCICDEEYSNAYSFVTGKTCVNVDECTLNTHNCCTHAGCSGCTDTDPGFTCACDVGYQGDGTSCAEIDECATGAHNCGTDPGMNCVNNDGSFDCICDEEYSNAYSFVTGKTCVNVDECTLNTHNCCTHAGCSGCTDTDPGFTCACDVGYRGDGTSCVDIDECDEDTVANLCGADSLLSCINNIGSYDCSCLDGYDMVFDSGLGEETCVQVDECADDNLHDCVTGFTGICTDKDPNVDGIKFECGCIEGFYGSGFANGQGCIQELDECTMGTHNCAADADCFDTQAAFICTCHPGFTDDNLDGTSCTNINECTDGTHNCAPDVDGGVCTDNPGSFECSCDNSIAYGDGLAAGTGCTLKVDECADNTHTCDANAACTDTQEAYTCTCNAGYDGPGFICYQVDECAEKGLDILGTAGVLVGTETNYADFVAQLDTMSGMVNGVVGSFHGALEDQFNIESTFTIGNTGGAEKVLFSLTGATNQFIPDLPVDTRDYFMSFEVVQDACSDPAQDASSTCTLTVAYETFLGGSEKSATIPYTLNNTCTDYTVADGCPMSVMILINRQGIAINGTVTYSMVVDLITPDGNVASTAFVDNNDHRMTEFRFVREGDSAALISSFYINQAGSETNNCDDDGGICTDTIGSFTCDCDLSTHFDNNSDEPGTDCVGLVDECTDGGHDCHPTGGVCTDLDDGWSCTCATTHFDLNPDDPGKQCDQLLPCDARLIGDVFDDSALSPRGFWDCNRGSKKTTCNYICPVSEAVGVTASCKHKSGLWRDPTRPLTCNLPPTCDLAALETEITDFLGRIGSTYVFNENDWQIDGLQEDNFLRGRWNCGNSFFTKKIQFSCNRKDGGTRAVWKFKGDPSDHPDVCQGIFRSEGLEVRSKYVKKA